MNNKLIKARTCVYNINYHIVWTVKYRYNILQGEVAKYLKEELFNIANDKDFTISSVECYSDHIHLFISAHPKVSPSYIVKMCKGITGRKLFIKFPELTENLWKDTLWSNSYYVETIGSTSEYDIEQYLKSQEKQG